MTYDEILIETYTEDILCLKAELSELTFFPEYTGEIVEKYVTCQRPNCICKRGFPHGPHKYYRYRENNRWKEIYLGKKNSREYISKVESNMKIRELKKEIAELEQLLSEAQERVNAADENQGRRDS